MKTSRSLLMLGVLAVIAAVLVGCSQAKPTNYRIAYVIGNGEGDSRSIKEVVMPGVTADVEKDDSIEYIYGNSRNWNIQNRDGADDRRVLTALSKPSNDGQTPGFNVQGSLIAYFAVNRPDSSHGTCSPDDKNSACRALFAFYQYCQKYGCTTGEDNSSDNPEDQVQSSDQGWLTMLREGLDKALEHAYVAVIPQYDVSVVNDPSKWPAIANEISLKAFEELPSIMGLPKGLNIFCSTEIINSGGKCEPFQVKFNSLSSPDAQRLMAQRRDDAAKAKAQLDKIADDQQVENQRINLERSKAQHDAELYAQPGYAAERRIEAEQQLLEGCKAAPPQGGTTPNCVVIVGSDSGTSQQLQLQVGK